MRPSLPGPPGVRTVAPARRFGFAPIALLAVLALVVFFALRACGGENANEKLATKVTLAIAANDVSPVVNNFNAIVRPKLTRAAVGRLSDQLVPLGKLKHVKETTPAGTEANKHYFDAQFEKGTWQEKMAIDADGKISSFDMRPTPSGK